MCAAQVIIKVIIDHLFDNLSLEKEIIAYYFNGKKSGKSLEFWIQKSVRMLFVWGSWKWSQNYKHIA